MFKNILSLLDGQFTGERIKHLAEPIYENDRWSSFDKYHQTADYCFEKMKEFGLKNVEIIPHPADGKTWCGDWIAPLGWIARKGIVKVFSPESEKGKLLADYQSIPNHLVRWSAPTKPGGEEIEVVYIEDASDIKQYEGKDIKGKLIFTHIDVYAENTKKLACKNGARGIIFDHSWGGMDYPDNVCWCNDWHNDIGWGPTIGDPPLIGIMISPRQGKYLYQLIKNNKKVTLHVDIDTEIKEDTIDIITGIIPGKDLKHEEVLVLGHIYECGADDNASGGAVMMEIMRVLTENIKNGKLPIPQRTIRILMGWEWLSSNYYAYKYKKRIKNTVAALCLDGTAMKQTLAESPFHIGLNPHAQVSYTDILIEDIYRVYFDDKNTLFKWDIKPFIISTDTFYADPTINIPTVYPAQAPGKGWHSSWDTIETLDEKVLEYAAVTSATYLYSIANAGEKEALSLGERCFAEGKKEISEVVSQLINSGIRRDYLEKFYYRTYLARKRLQSIKRISPDNKYIDGLDKELSKFINNEVVSLEKRMRKISHKASTRETIEKKSPRWLNIAENIIPHRAMLGPIFHHAARMPAELREKYLSLSNKYKESIFWIDGKRNLREVIRLWSLEKNIPEDGQIIKLYRAYEKAGYIKLEYKIKLNKNKIISALRENGIQKGDVILVHSSLNSLGYINGGVTTIIKALEETVGQEGTVVMPSFTYSTVSSGKPYNFQETTSMTKTGEISDVFWRQKNVLRSKHPSHSLAACGKYAELITKNHEKYNPYAKEGGFGKLYQLNAKILMIGCGLAPNSTLHAVEDWSNHPSMVPDEYLALNEKGDTVKIRYEREPQGHRDFYLSGERVTKSEKMLREYGVIKDFKIGIAAVHLMKIRKLMDTCLRHMKKDPNFLLCDNHKCKYCQEKKKKALEMKSKGQLVFEVNKSRTGDFAE